MDKIEINEENYAMYQEFLDIRNNKVTAKNKKTFIGAVAIITLFSALGLFGIVNITIMVLDAIIEHNAPALLGAFIESLGVGSVWLFMSRALDIVEFIQTKILHRKYPNLDIKIEESELEWALEKYIQLSKILTNLQNKKEKHLVINNDRFKKMTTEERLEFLKKEKEFWEQVAIEEKYQSEGEDTTGQAGIGQVQDSNEDKNKVYHI